MLKQIMPILCLSAIVAAVAPALPARAEAPNYKRTVEKYTVPDVVLLNQNGQKVRFKELVRMDKPVIVDFVFATCTTICPVLSAGYANFQQKLGADTRKVQLISISIDPEHDSPNIMRDYLKRYRAKPGWDFLTGTRPDIDKVLNAFKAYIPNKMSHYPLTLIHLPGESSWIRVYGLMGGSEFMNECRKAGI